MCVPKTVNIASQTRTNRIWILQDQFQEIDISNFIQNETRYKIYYVISYEEKINEQVLINSAHLEVPYVSHEILLRLYSELIDFIQSTSLRGIQEYAVKVIFEDENNNY